LRESDLPALRRCFRAVFIDKHSAWNPDFTAAFFSEIDALVQSGRLVPLAVYVPMPTSHAELVLSVMV
jgi:hypothetical protein